MTQSVGYSIVLISYKPPGNFFELIKTLRDIDDLDIYIIDSSPYFEWLEIKNEIDSMLSSKDVLSKIKYFHIENKGLGYSMNYGIMKCIDDGKELFTIIDDDASVVRGNFIVGEIVEFFNKYIDPKRDALILADGRHIKDVYTWVDTGITFTKYLFNDIKFREEFVMDQIDHDFCVSIHRNGGRILMYPKRVLFNQVVGREARNGINFLPAWRTYTLIRNVLVLWAEGKMGILNLLYNVLIFCKALLFGRKKVDYLKSFYNGAKDGLNHELGITSSLQKLSGNRFKL